MKSEIIVNGSILKDFFNSGLGHLAILCIIVTLCYCIGVIFDAIADKIKHSSVKIKNKLGEFGIERDRKHEDL